MHLAENGYIKVIISMFFHYEWNNILHNTVSAILKVILKNDIEVVLIKYLFEDASFIDELIEKGTKAFNRLKQGNCELKAKDYKKG